MKKVFNIRGMNCRACEIQIEKTIKGVAGVDEVTASTKKGQVEVFGSAFYDAEIVDAIKGAGYEVGPDNLPILNLNKKNLVELFKGLGLFLIFFIVIKLFSIDEWFLGARSGSSLASVFTIGLTAGLSTCMALVGGLVLGVSARFAEKHPNASFAEKFKPHLSFNLGRVLFFTLMGGLLGSFGSLLKLTGFQIGFLTIIAGVMMLIIGIQLLEIFPRFNTVTIPKFITNLLKLDQKNKTEFSHKRSMILGSLTFFLPCGFTQAMQVYAVSTGSIIQGATIMGMFALGTVPGLLGIGGLVSNIRKNNLGRIIFKAVGILVILLSIYNLKNGFLLTGLKAQITKNHADSQQNNTMSASGRISTSSELKIFRASYDPSDFQNTIKPNSFQARVGDIVRIEILAKKDGQGCMGSIMIPGLYNIPQFFVKDETTIIEFKAQKSGIFQMTCAMGVPNGTIEITN